MGKEHMATKLVIRVNVKSHWPLTKARTEVREIPLTEGHVLYRFRLREDSTAGVLFVDIWTVEIDSVPFEYNDYDSGQDVEVRDVSLADVECISIEPS